MAYPIETYKTLSVEDLQLRFLNLKLLYDINVREKKNLEDEDARILRLAELEKNRNDYLQDMQNIIEAMKCK